MNALGRSLWNLYDSADPSFLTQSFHCAVTKLIFTVEFAVVLNGATSGATVLSLILMTIPS